MIDLETARSLVANRPWHHDWEIIPGVRTHGSYNPAPMLASLNLPERLDGVSVADIGASNGYFSFALAQRGAKVAAFDYRHKDNSGFGLAQFINDIKGIPHIQANVLELCPEKHWTYDIVLCLGLLYHTPDPYMALARCASLAKDRIFVESYCDPLAHPLTMRFLPDAERFPGEGQPNADRSNYWRFSPDCLKAMLVDNGFAVTRMEAGGDRCLLEGRRELPEPPRGKLSYSVMPAQLMIGDPLNPASWRIF